MADKDEGEHPVTNPDDALPPLTRGQDTVLSPEVILIIPHRRGKAAILGRAADVVIIDDDGSNPEFRENSRRFERAIPPKKETR